MSRQPNTTNIQIPKLSEQTLHNVLVVDDEEPIRIMISEILQDSGYQVTAVESADEAFSTFQDHEYGVVISDIRMKGMNGIQLLSKLKAINQSVPVIIMTSYATLDATIEVLKAGAFDFLVKPFDELDFVVNAVNKASDNYRLILERELLINDLATKNKELERVIHHLSQLAVVDGLTGLFNHRHMQELLTREIARSQRTHNPLSVLFIDVDHFKQFNDNYGHQAGDDLLKQLAELFRNSLRTNDIIARYGGEEFVIILPEINKDNALIVAEKLRAQTERTEFLEQTEKHSVTISVGVATYGENGTDNETLLRKADEALYVAKDQGRNCVRS
ncbi:MAG: diguanylate cyclase [Gammaproteobacteria bacterium]|nr:diguanylate cyclase [Gammaproteobacteria bacterium]MDH5731004.1 diguanylate cyclase [Gammaproteobacteria bacterium]